MPSGVVSVELKGVETLWKVMVQGSNPFGFSTVSVREQPGKMTRVLVNSESGGWHEYQWYPDENLLVYQFTRAGDGDRGEWQDWRGSESAAYDIAREVISKQFNVPKVAIITD